MMEISVSFFAGILSFFSPCIFPLIPVYLSLISGINICEAEQKTPDTRKIIIASILFVLGFSIAFTMLGASSTFLGNFLFKNKKFLSVIIGIVIIIFSLHLAGIFNLKFLNYEKKLRTEKLKFGFFSSLIMGFVFALGWMPCIGPILAGMLAMAAVKESVYKGMILLFTYSMGLGIPFILAGIFACKIMNFFSRSKKFVRYSQIIAAVLLFTVGIILIFQIKLPYFRV